MSHPFASLDHALQKAAAGLVSDVLPGLEKVTRPDLGRAWFTHAYAGAFAIALLAFVLLVGWNFVQRARGRIAGEELVESLVLYGPLFLTGAVFGPAAGAFLLRFTGALTDSVCSFFGTSGTPSGSTSRLQEVIAAATPTGVTGGAVVGVLFLLALVLALVMVFGVLLVMSVTLYLTGVIAPLSLVWLVHPHRRGRGFKVANVWVGICFSHVLLFFLLGAVFSMFADLPFTHDLAPGATGPHTAHMATAAATGATPGGSPFAELVALAVAVIALFTAVLSPLGLLRFAPVAPTAAPGAGRAAGGPGRVPGARPGGGSGRGRPEPSGRDADADGGRGPAGTARDGSGARPSGGGLVPSPAAYRRGAADAGSGAGGGSGAAAGRAGSPAGAAGGLAAAAGPVGAAVALAAKGARKARAAGEAAAAHMGHGDAGHGAGEGLAPRHNRR